MKVLKCFLISFLINFCDSGLLPCTDCALKKSELPVDKLKQMRYEYLKDQILKKLHLTEPPRINSPKPPLNSLLVIAEMVENETIPENGTQPKTENTVIYPKNESLPCSESLSNLCKRYEFSIPENLLLENFVSAEVWMNKNNANVFQAYQVIEDNLQNIMGIYELSNTAIEKFASSWSKYNVLRDSISSNNASGNILVIEVIDDRKKIHLENIVEKKDKMPFLVIRSEIDDGKGSTRHKRSITCEGKAPSCCKENFYLSFSEIGWDNWILHPEGYHANFCRGRCFDDLSNTRFYHSAVLLSFMHDNRDLAEEIGISMCCTPSVMSPLTIFYRNEEQLIYQKRVDNMKVEDCNCA